MNNHRGKWSSKLTFVFAAAGSAVGLGNLWRFSYEAGNNGGGLFVLIYLAAVAFIALPVLMAELSLGRFSRLDTVGAFTAVKPNTRFKLIGYLGFSSAVGILSFYGVVAGMTIGYLYKAITGQFAPLAEIEAVDTMVDKSQGIFSAFATDYLIIVPLVAVFLILTIYVVSRGIAGGIEKFTKIFMPVLLVILIIMIVRAVTLPNAFAGIAFYLQPKLSSLTPSLVISAVGQAFFSLSLGMGTMITYGSYVEKKESLPKAAGMIAAFDTGIAILAGFIVFPVIFSLSMSPEQGAGGMFVVLPILFSKIAFGQAFGILFFALLAIAALTSTISLLEVPVAYMVDQKNWNRKKAAWVVGTVTFAFAVPAALSEKFFGIFNLIWGSLALTVGGFFIAIFVGWVWKPQNALKELAPSSADSFLAKTWATMIKYIIPVIILVIFASIIIGQF